MRIIKQVGNFERGQGLSSENFTGMVIYLLDDNNILKEKILIPKKNFLDKRNEKEELQRLRDLEQENPYLYMEEVKKFFKLV